MPRRPQDAKLKVIFSTREVLNEAKSFGAVILDNNNNVHEKIEGAGRPVHDNVDYVLVYIPGDRDNVVDRPVMCCDKRLLERGAKLTPMLACRARKGFDERPMLEECDVHRFADEFAAFRAGQADQTAKGTDLKMWAGIDPASVADLAYHHVFTVEDLADLNDSLAGPRFLALRTRARDYLASAKKTAGDINVRAELDAKDKQLAAMQEQINQLLSAQPKPTPAATKGKAA